MTVGVTLVTEPKPVEELARPRLRHGEDGGTRAGPATGWYRSPALLGFIVLAMTAAISVLLI